MPITLNCLSVALALAASALFSADAAVAQTAPQVPARSANDQKPPELPSGLTPEELKQLLQEQTPLTAEQVLTARKASQQVEKAMKARLGPPPRPVSEVMRVRFAAGATPQVLRIATGYVSTVVFSDVTGAPWNVLRVIPGNKGQLRVPEAEKEDGSSNNAIKTNSFTVAPLVDEVTTNLAIYLEGAPAPITMIVATGQPEVDFRLDVSVQARGPAAVAPTLSRGLAESVSPELTNMVAGLTPTQAKPLKIISSDVADVQAWVMGQRMFVRARANVLTPPVPKDGKVASGPDGTKVFELPIASEVLLMQGGSVGRLRLAGFPAPSPLPEKAN